DGAAVTIKDKDGKTLGQFGPGKPPAAAADPDRKAAEYVLSLGGVVRVNGEERNRTAAAELPKERFILTSVDLYTKPVTDAGLAHFRDCKGLAYLWLHTTQLTDAGLAHFKDCKALTILHLANTKLTNAGLANFKDCKGLTDLYLNDTPVTDA